MSDQRLYRVVFFNQGQSYEVYARQIAQGGLYGFVEVEDLVFGKTSQLVVDPSEERLQKEFEGVKRFYVPMHSVVRIDEVEKEGVSRVIPPPKDQEENNVAPFPVPIYSPQGGGGAGND